LAQQSPAFLRPLEQRYDPLVVNKTTACIVPCQQTQKADQISQKLLPLVLTMGKSCLHSGAGVMSIPFKTGKNQMIKLTKLTKAK